MKDTNKKPKPTKTANFTPIKPFQDLRDNPHAHNIPSTTFTQSVKEKYSELLEREKDNWRSYYAMGEINSLFIQGEQTLQINTFTGMPYAEKTDKKNPMHIRCINKTQGYATVWLDKFTSSNPDITLAPFSNSDSALSRTKKANAAVDHLERSFFTNDFNQEQGLNAMVWGNWINRVRADHEAKKSFVMKDDFKDEEHKIGTPFGRCGKCSYAGGKSKEKEGKHHCPECDNENFEFRSPISLLLPKKTGEKKIFLPEIVIENLPFSSTRWDIKTSPECSSWLITERYVPEAALRRMFKHIRFPEGESGNDFGLDTVDRLAARAAEFGGSTDKSSVSKDTNEKRILITEMYLGEDDAFDITIGADEKTVEGAELPKGRLSDMGWDGYYLIGINGMSLILGVYNESHIDSVSSGKYHRRPGSGIGRGMDDVPPVQNQINRRYSQMDAHFGSRATPPILGIENGIDPKHRRLLNQPGAYIPVKLQNFPEFKDVRALMSPLQGQSLPGDFINHTNNVLEQQMQFAFHTTSMGGIQQRNVSNDTATYAEIADSNSDAVFAPLLANKAASRVTCVKLGFYKWIKHTPEPRFMPNDDGTGVEISGADIDGEYIWSYVPGSEAPKNRYTENQSRANFFGLFGGVNNYLTAKQQFPADVAKLEQDFDVNFASSSADTMAETCRMRWERAKSLLQRQTEIGALAQMVGVGAEIDYLSIIEQVKPMIHPLEPKLMEKMVWYQELLDTDEGRDMPDETRMLCAGFIEAFRNLTKIGAIRDSQDAAQVEVEGSAPIREAQAAEQAQAQQAEQQANAESSNEQMMAGAADKIATLAAQEQSEMRQGEQAQADRERDILVEGIKSAAQVEASSQKENAGS